MGNDDEAGVERGSIDAAARGSAAVVVSILGPVVVTVGGDPVEVRGELGRSLVARLAVASPHPVSEAEIAAAIWEAPPAKPELTIRPIVSRLRGRVGSDAIVREAIGFRLGADVEVDSFQADAAARHGEIAPTDPAMLDDVTSALALWRGTALMDVAPSAFFLGARQRLEGLRHDLRDLRCELLLDLGDPSTALIELTQLARSAPHRERTHMSLMRALHATGNARDAMRVGAAFRSRWSELGQSVSAAFDEFDRAFAATLASDDHRDREWGMPGVVTSVRGPERRTGGLVGRSRELSDVRGLIARRPVTTLVGPGGVGKSRLAIEAATGHPTLTAHVVLLAGVELTNGAAGDDLALAVADAMHLESVGVDALEAVSAWIGSRECVVVLDNCEHVIDAAGSLVWELTQRCPRVRFLATSRTPLALPNESVYRVPPLDTVGVAEPSPAAELLAARSAQSGFHLELGAPGQREQAEEICELLDGLPLAIELAAARLPVLGLDGMRTYIRRGRVDVLANDDGDDRHSSIGSTVEWSREMIGPGAAELLPRLVVFPSWFNADQVARVVCHESPVEPLSELVEASFVELQPGADRSRYRMLKPIKQAIAQGIDPLELDVLRDRHAEWGLELADRALERAVSHQLGAAQQLIDEHVADLVDAVTRRSRATGRDHDAIDRAAMALAPLLLETPRPRLIAAVAEMVGESVEGRIASAWRHVHIGGHERAFELAVSALDELPNDDERVVLATFPAVIASLMAGEYDRTLELVERHVPPHAPAHFVGAAAVATAAFARSYLGEVDGAVRLFDDYRDLLDVCRTGGYVDFVRAEIVMASDLDRCRFHSRRGLEAALVDRSRTGVTRSGLQQLAIELVAQDPGSAASVALDHIPDLIATGQVPTAWIGLRYVAQALLAGGDRASATELMTAAHADPRNPQFPQVDADSLAPADLEERQADLWTVWELAQRPLMQIAGRDAIAAS